MKKTFSLKAENKTPERHLEAVKNEIRKYIKREKKKKLPIGVDYWDFKCKFGKNDDKPKVILFVDIMKNVNEAFEADCETFYMEILATEGIREPREPRKKDEE